MTVLAHDPIFHSFSEQLIGKIHIIDLLSLTYFLGIITACDIVLQGFQNSLKGKHLFGDAVSAISCLRKHNVGFSIIIIILFFRFYFISRESH